MPVNPLPEFGCEVPIPSVIGSHFKVTVAQIARVRIISQPYLDSALFSDGHASTSRHDHDEVEVFAISLRVARVGVEDWVIAANCRIAATCRAQHWWTHQMPQSAIARGFDCGGLNNISYSEIAFSRS